MINKTWDSFLDKEFNKEYFKKLSLFLKDEYLNYDIHPAKQEVFASFYYTDKDKVKVVILGQDPYPTVGHACGLAFAVKPGVKLPGSLKNIYHEIENEYHLQMSDDGYLIKWSKQGVLLLNTCLTVRDGMPNSHAKKGWEIFTDNVIKELDSLEQPIVFLLWGNNAKEKKRLLTNPNHLILESAHPSPLSAYNGFFGNNHFLKANEYLEKNNLPTIEWQM